MIRAFLLHHHERAQRSAITNAITNCHAVGLHSIMLHDEPRNRIRMFVATHDHELWDGSGNPALAVHAHHCDVMLQCVFGPVTNWNYSDVRPGSGPFEICSYSSGITETAGLRGLGMRCDFGSVRSELLGEKPVSLRAQDHHTITIARGQQAAWLVFEGAEDATYQSQCYSRAPEIFDASKLYKPMKQFDIETYLMLCLLRLPKEVI